MLWTERLYMIFSFLRKSLLWVALLPYGVYWTGVASNQAVLIANHGAFPVQVNGEQLKKMEAPEILITPFGIVKQKSDVDQLPDGTVMLDEVHCVMTSKTHLNWLAEIFYIRGDGIYSIGDALLFLGEDMMSYCLVIWAMLAGMKLYKQSE